MNNYDNFGANLVHYVAACDLHEIVPKLKAKSVTVKERVKDGNLTPLLIASVCGKDKTVKELLKAGASLVEEETGGSAMSEHDLFVEMLNREFPSSSVHVEQSSLQPPSSLNATKKRGNSPSNYALPRKCGISEQESKFLNLKI